MIYALTVSVALLASQDMPPTKAPAPVPATNAVTENAQAVYLADAAAERRGQRSELAVLGTAHLSSLPGDFDRKRFQPLIDRLKAWAPDRIAIESLSGAQCDYLRAYAFAYEGTADRYCFDPDEARTALGMDGAQAAADIERILAKPVEDRPPGERRRLAGLFLAAGDPSSALVQWLRLPPDERRADDRLTDALVELLDARAARMNENVVIAVALAVELGHERLFPVDDHTGGRATGPVDEEVYADEITGIWDNEWSEARGATLEAWHERITSDATASILDWYRVTNSPEEARAAVASDFGAAAGADVPGNSGRKYLAYWETRNMRMAANIREVIGAHRRVLAIVGSSHKPYYERYLGVTSDLEIVDVETLLK
jgi:hypothetical protein